MAERKIVATSTMEKMDDTVSHPSRTSSNAEGSKILPLPPSEKQNIWHQKWDVLQVIEDAQLLDQLQLGSRSNKSIEVRFESERAAQHFYWLQHYFNWQQLHIPEQCWETVEGAHPRCTPQHLWCSSEIRAESIYWWCLRHQKRHQTV